VVWAIGAIAAIWLVAIAGYTIAKNAKVTPEKVRAYVASVDFGRLTAAQREEAIRKLAAMLNRLSLEERQRLRLDQTAYRWFEQMTEDEKGEFLEATMPTGLKQMLNAFEQMPEDRRRRAVTEAVQRLKTTRENFAKTGELPPQSGTNNATMSPELQQKMATIGLKTFYSQSSAQAKAELAPLLEEMQRMMESGLLFRGGPRR
jgi:hypothetical protein